MRLASSLAIRLTGALIAVTFLATASLLAGIYYFGVRIPMDEVRTMVRHESAQLQAIYEQKGEPARKAALVERRRAPSPNKAFDALLDRDGKLLSGNLPSWPLVRRGNWANIEADLYRDGDEDDHEALSRDNLLPDGRRLIVGRDVEVLADRKELMGEAAMWGSLSVLLFGMLGGLLISWFTARRLEAVTGTAREVMGGNLSVRVPLKGTGDDFDQLGMSLNAMLDRNQELVASLGRVSDNIAHELRTPLARLRTFLEGSSPDGLLRTEDVAAARVEADRLQEIFDALLRIARLDTGRHRIIREPVPLDELVSDAVEFYAPQAEARQQSIGASVTSCTIVGDRNLIFQAIANLLDNALKFAPAGGEVRADLEVEGRSAKLIVRDTGPGVDAEHRERLTERFFRAPGSEAVAGTGLGLTLVEAIVAAHRGILEFSDDGGGFAVTVRLPLVPK
jgi:signal transduction histidine kinase